MLLNGLRIFALSLFDLAAYTNCKIAYPETEIQRVYPISTPLLTLSSHDLKIMVDAGKIC